MPVCSAIGCKNRSSNKPLGVTFHRFPKESVLRAAWIVACRRKNWLPTRYSVLCSEHFSEDLIDRKSSFNFVRLRPNAIPNIFKLPSGRQNIKKDRRRKKELLDFTPTTDFLHNEDTQSCDENTSKIIKECGVEEAGLISVENESSTEYVLPVTISEKCDSTEKQKRSAFKAALSFVKEVIESTDEAMPETPKKRKEMKPIACSNSSSKESGAENRPPLQISEKCESTEKQKRSAFKAALSFVKEVIESTDEAKPETPKKRKDRKPISCSNSLSNESGAENRPPSQIPEKCESTEKQKRSAFKAALSFVKEVIESTDEAMPETPKKRKEMKPIACSNSPSNEFGAENRPPLQPTVGSLVVCSPKRPESFSQVINYAYKVKDDQSGTKPPTEEEVYAQIAKLFENEVDLVQEFSQFLANSNGSVDMFDGLVPEESKSPKHSLCYTTKNSFLDKEKNQSSDESGSKATPAPCLVIETPRFYSPAYVIPEKFRSPKHSLHSTTKKSFLNKEKNQSSDESGSKVTPAPCIVIETPRLYSPAYVSIAENGPSAQVPEKSKSPKHSLRSTTKESFLNKEKNQSSDESGSKATPAPCFVIETPRLYLPAYVSSAENGPSAQVPENSKSPKHSLCSTTQKTIKEENQSSDESASTAPPEPCFGIETPGLYSQVYLSSAENELLAQVPKKSKSRKNGLYYMTRKTFKEENQSSDESASTAPPESCFGIETPRLRSPASVSSAENGPLAQVPKKSKSRKNGLHYMTRKTFKEENQSSDESASTAPPEPCFGIETPRLYSPASVSSAENGPLAQIPEKSKSPKHSLHSTTIKTFLSEEKNQSSDKSGSEAAPAPCFVIETPRLNLPAYVSSVENKPSAQIPGRSWLKIKSFPSTAPSVFLNIQNIQPSVMATAGLVAPIIESGIESVPLTKIPGISKTNKEYMQFAALKIFSRNHEVQSRSLSSTGPVARKTTACSNSRFPIKRKFPQNGLTSKIGTTSSSNEVIESTEEGMLETSLTDQRAMDPLARFNSKDTDSEVSSDSEDYPWDDVEKKYLKRKLEESRKILSHYRKKIKFLQQQNRRYRSQVDAAKITISALKKKNKTISLSKGKKRTHKTGDEHIEP